MLARGRPSYLPTTGVGSASLWSGRSRLTRTRSTWTGCPHLLLVAEDEVVGASHINTELGRMVFDPDKPDIKFLRLVIAPFMKKFSCSNILSMPSFMNFLFRTSAASTCEKCINILDKKLEFPVHEFQRTSDI